MWWIQWNTLSDAPHLSRCRFDKMLTAIRYSKSDLPRYKDRFWEVRKLIQAWNDNMNSVFAPGWVSCHDESMSPCTDKYTRPNHMCVPRKPWPLGNKYHSICCCVSKLIYTVELVEDKDCTKDVTQEFTDNPKFRAITSPLLRLCKFIFNIGMVVILDSGFWVLPLSSCRKEEYLPLPQSGRGDISRSMLMEITSTYTLKIRKLVVQIYSLAKWMMFVSVYMQWRNWTTWWSWCQHMA